MSLTHLILMRHAKSSWSEGRLSDHERPLNGRGQKAAKTIGGVLRAKKLFPDIIWSSDSARTRETVDRLMMDTQTTDVTYLPEFYHAPANKVLYTCEQRGEPKEEALMLMGHNPGWEDLLYHFTDIPRRMPTGGCAILARTDTNGDWLDADTWRLKEYLLPRDYE